MSTNKIELAQTALSNDFTDTYKSELQTAYANNHTHSNKTALDNVSGINTGDQNLSNLANISFSNINATAKTLVANKAMPSNSSVVLTLGSTGSTYTALADGYVQIQGTPSTTSHYVQVANISAGYLTDFCPANATNWGLSAYIPVKKDDVVQYYYNTTSGNSLKFIYAEGSKP